ncbi:ABC transporter permease [Rubripirellula reticaptiva]|nr:ABC transporter permease [Rubripirellula reticaptiva]
MHLVPSLCLTDSMQFADSMILAQGANWLPAWLTPLYVIAIAILIGAAAAILLYGLLSLLSFIPVLGRLADSPKRAIIASLVIGGLFSGVLCSQYVPNSGEDDFAYALILPLTTIGMLFGFGIIYGMWHRTRSEWFEILGEGVVPYLLGVAGLFVVIGLASAPLVTEPMAFFDSIPAVNLVGDGVEELTVVVPGVGDADPDTSPFHQASIEYSLRNMSVLQIRSDKTVLIADSADTSAFSKVPHRVNADEEQFFRSENRDVPPIPGDPSRLHIQNREINPATVVFSITSTPPIPEAKSIVAIAFSFLLSITAIMTFRQAAPRVWALALSTAKNEMAQPLYLLLMTLGIVGVVFFGFYPFNTLGDDIRLLKDSGVTLIMVLGMLQAVWSAGTTVSDEIEGRTALTVLSKPVSRRSFILGKYAGIMLSVLVLFAIIGAVLLIVISYKPIYDARETSRAATVWQNGFEEIITTIPILGLYFMETMAIGAIAVALATRLPLLANFITCFVVYVIGNLTSPLVASTKGNNELVGFVGKLIAVVVPNLNIFNVQAAVDAGNAIPLIYLAGAFNYLVCFAIAIWMLAMLLFEDRDLA